MKRIVLLISFFFSAHLLLGQDVQFYQGTYKFNGIEGEAKFNYQLNAAQESILEGDFIFESSAKDSFSENIFEKKAVKGKFEFNKKVGQWTYLDEIHQVTLQEVVDFKVISKLQSQQTRIIANYKSGLPHGKWTIEENTFEGDKMQRAAQSDAILFRDGNLVDNVLYKTFKGDQTQFLRGKLNPGGILHGELALVYLEDGKLISEIRNYERGFLLGLVKRDLLSDEVIEEVIFYNTIEKLKQIEAGTQSGFRIADEVFDLTYKDGFLDDGSEYVAQSKGNEFVETFLKKLLKNDTSFVDGEGRLLMSPIHTKRFVYELSRGDQKAIEEIPILYRENVSKTSAYLSENSLNLLKNKSDSTLLAFNYLQLQAEKLLKLENLFSQIESKDIQFLDLAELFAKYFTWIGESDSLQITYKDQLISEVVTYPRASSQEGLIQSLQGYLEDQKSQLRKRFVLLDIALQAERNSAELLKLSQEIETYSAKVRALYSSDSIEDHRQVQLLRNVSTNILTNQLRAFRVMFASDGAYEAKQKDSEMILMLLSTMESQFPKILEFQAEFDQLDVRYQEEIFNPFTYTRYNQRVQERLFESYEILFDHYIDQIQNAEDFNVLNSLTTKILNLNQKMKDLRGQDTRRLEKRLNRVKSPEQLESLLEL